MSWHFACRLTLSLEWDLFGLVLSRYLAGETNRQALLDEFTRVVDCAAKAGAITPENKREWRRLCDAVASL